MGVKKLFRCRNFPKCPYRLQVYYPSCSTDVVIMHNEKNHLHDDRIGGRFNGKAVLKLIQNDIKKKPIEII